MRDDELVTVPRVVLDELHKAWGPTHGWQAQMTYGALCYARSTRGSGSGPLMRMWLSTFDQDPVTIPEVLFEEESFFNEGGGRTRTRLQLAQLAREWLGLEATNIKARYPKSAAFLSLFLPEDKVDVAPPMEVCEVCSCVATYVFHGQRYCAKHWPGTAMTAPQPPPRNHNEFIRAKKAGVAETVEAMLGGRPDLRLDPCAPGVKVVGRSCLTGDCRAESNTPEAIGWKCSWCALGYPRMPGHALPVSKTMTRLQRVAAGLEKDPYLMEGKKKRDINGLETPGEWAWTTNDPENGPTRGGMKGGYQQHQPGYDDQSGDDVAEDVKI